MDVMIDIETLGTGGDAAVVQIAAVLFEPVFGGKVRDGNQRFNCLVDPSDAISLGANVTMSTLKWWMDQDKETQRIFDWNHEDNANVPKASTEQALLWLCEWLPEATDHQWNQVRVWANGIVFDLGILQRHFERFGIIQPWTYNAAMDMRTVLKLTGGWPKIDETGFTKHNALDDCMMQIAALQIALGKMHRPH